MKKLKKRTLTLIAAFFLIFAGSISAFILQTDFGKVTVEDIYLPTENQNYLHALAFIPKEASADHQVPLVITAHGWLNSAEVQDAACIELSRRGIAVISIDVYNHGLSGSIDSCQTDDAIETGGGLKAMVEYCASGVLNYINTDQIGLMGHSMGANGAKETAFYYSTLYDQAVSDAQAPDSDGGEVITDEEQAYCDSVMKVKAILPTGQTPSFLNYSGIDWQWSQLRCNAGIVYGTLEECGYLNSTGSAHVLGDAAETVNMIQSADPSVTYVEEGVYYGDKNANNLRVIYQPTATHPLIHFNSSATADVIDFWTYVFDVQTDLTPANQTWLLKEWCNLFAMIGLFMCIVPICSCLLENRTFSMLQNTAGPALPAFKGSRRLRFWIGSVLGGLISLGVAFLTIVVVPTADPAINNGYLQTSVFWFAVPAMNTIGFWTLICALWQLLWFWWNYKKDTAIGIDRKASLGIAASAKQILMSILLSICLIAAVYIIVFFCKWAFNTDFRFWTPAVKTFNVGKLFYFLQYLPAFLLFYFANSLIVNSAGRFEGMNKKLNIFMHACTNIIGCALFVAIQYGCLLLGGEILIKGQWLNVVVIGFCMWQLFLAPFLLRRFYELTGKHWVGAITVSSLYVLIGIMNTAVHSTLL